MGLGYLSGPKVVPNEPSASKSYPNKEGKKSKSKLRLPIITMGLDESLNQSL